MFWHYRPHYLRRFTILAACIALLACGGYTVSKHEEALHPAYYRVLHPTRAEKKARSAAMERDHEKGSAAEKEIRQKAKNPRKTQANFFQGVTEHPDLIVPVLFIIIMLGLLSGD